MNTDNGFAEKRLKLAILILWDEYFGLVTLSLKTNGVNIYF